MTDAAREIQLAKPDRSAFTHAFGYLVATLGVLLASIGGLLASSEPRLGGATLAAFGVLMIVAEHRDRLFGDETSMSGSIVVAMAAVAAFRTSSPLLGPFLCGATAGLYWPHLRDHAWSKVTVNAASIAFSTLAAALVMQVGSSAGSLSSLDVVVLGIPAVLSYWIVNSMILAWAVASLRRDRFRRSLLGLIRSEPVMLLFALGGALCGLLFLEVGTWAGALALALVLLVVDITLISRPRPSSVRMRHPGLAAAAGRGVALASGGFAAFAVSRWISPLGGVPVGAGVACVVTIFMTAGLLRRRLGEWDLRLASGVAVAEVPEALVAGCAGTVASAVGAPAGAAVALIGVAGIAQVLAWRRRRTAAKASGDHERALEIVERTLLDWPDVSSH